ncbi:tetratricopeptide repeat protein 19, mitochondrial isoform X2 [Columba livia]|uniref:tetratricopeptide repeat protein 19, mitochondrial isoform X2 n=1 Tax=Columba livia TaxID=8932 RepID=UPI0031BB3005
MLAAGLSRLLCRLVARRCPAGLRPLRTARRGGARGEEDGGGGGSSRTGFARRRWARPAGGALGFLGALSLFPRNAEEDDEDAIILLLKKAKLSVMKGELGEADRILHEALRLSHQADNRDAIVYTYSMVSELRAGWRCREKEERLCGASALSVSSRWQTWPSCRDSWTTHELAVAGYQFCILTLEEKIAKQKDLPEDVLPAEEKANTRLLLGMSLDSYARYLLNINQLPAAQQMYEKALQISNDVQGETHPQTVVLMNDLATVLDAQGHYDEAYSYVKRAAELAKETEHSEEHMVLNNLAAILMHKEDFLQAKQVYKEALKQAQQKGDVVSVQHIQEELAELAKRRKGSK